MGKFFPTLKTSVQTEGKALLGVQLDDKVHSDIEVDIGLGRHSNHFTLEGILITVQPLGGSNKRVILFQLLKKALEALFSQTATTSPVFTR